MLQRACCLLFAFAVTAAAQVPKPQYPPTHWPIRNGSFDIHNFRFGTGEALPDAHLHYLTLGTATVKCHVSTILMRLNVSDRTQAVVTALQRGLVHL